MKFVFVVFVVLHLRFQCSSDKLDSPAIITDTEGSLASICKQLFIKFKDMQNEEGDGKFLRVGISHSSLPGDRNEVELIKKPLPIKEEELNLQLQSLKLGQGPSTSKWKNQCGNFFLIVSLWDQGQTDSKGKLLEFDTLSLRKECNDKPALSLKVDLKTKTNAGVLRGGMVNPFKTMGVNSIEVVNKADNCEGCGQTDMLARWGADMPDVVAFFVPLGLNESFELLSSIGFKNPPSEDGFLDEPEAVQKLIKLGIEDLNMFGKPKFLHSSPIFSLASSEFIPNVKIGETLGEIELDKTSLPMSSLGQGLLVVALDPLQKLSDVDRIDNVFMQLITLDAEEISYSEDQTCDVVGLGSSQEPEQLFYNGNKGSLYKTWGNRANYGKIVAQLGKLKASTMENYCKDMRSMIQSRMKTNKPIPLQIQILLDEIVSAFEATEHKSKTEAETIGKILRLLTDAVDIVNSEDELMNLFINMAKQTGGKKMDSGKEELGRNGWDEKQGMITNGKGGSGKIGGKNGKAAFGKRPGKGGFGGEGGKTGFAGLMGDEEHSVGGNSGFNLIIGEDKNGKDGSRPKGKNAGTMHEQDGKGFGGTNDKDKGKAIFDFMLEEKGTRGKQEREDNDAFHELFGRVESISKGGKKGNSRKHDIGGFGDIFEKDEREGLMGKRGEERKERDDENFDYGDMFGEIGMPNKGGKEELDILNLADMLERINEEENGLRGSGEKLGRKGKGKNGGMFEPLELEDFGSKDEKESINGMFKSLDLEDFGDKVYGGKTENGENSFGGMIEPLELVNFYRTEDKKKKGKEKGKEQGGFGGLFESLDLKTFGRKKRSAVGIDIRNAEQMSTMAAMGLQGLLMMDHKEMGKIPRIVAEGPTCLKEILWSPDATPKGFICSKLPSNFRKQIRDLMMMILKKDIPMSLFQMDWIPYGIQIQHSGVIEKVSKIAMTKIMLPIASSDIKELMEPMVMLVKKIEKSETNSEKKNILKIFTALVIAIDRENVYKQIADIAHNLQSMFILKKGKAMMTGVAGPQPSDQALCRAFATYTLDMGMKGEPMRTNDIPTIWEEKGGTIYKGELCPFFGKWFWSPVAKCSCFQQRCGEKDKF